MNKTDREIEQKFYVDGVDYTELCRRVDLALGFNGILLTTSLHCSTMDYYWRISDGKTLRLRDSWGHTDDGFSRSLKEVTLKSKDKGNNLDRLELNLGVLDSQTAYSILESIHGKPVGRINKDKEYVVFTRDGAVISVALVNDELFLEVEGESFLHVNQYVGLIQQEVTLQPETRSLFEIFISREAA